MIYALCVMKYVTGTRPKTQVCVSVYQSVCVCVCECGYVCVFSLDKKICSTGEMCCWQS